MAKKTDQFANKFYGTVTESAANTLTFAEIPTQVDVFSKKAWILHRIEYYINGAFSALFNATGDKLALALTSSDKITSLSLSDAGVIDLFELKAEYFTAAGFLLREEPLIRTFNDMPGGGLIISPRPLYLAVKGESLSGAATVQCRGYFTGIDLNADEYLELVDFYRIVQ